MAKKIAGFDVGTGNLVVAELNADNQVSTHSMRNMYFPLDPEILGTSMFSPEKNDYVEVKDDDGNVEKIALIGVDAYDLCNAVNKEVCRPMKKGIISSDNMESLDIVALMISKLMGGRTDDGYCVYSVPAQPIDIEAPSVLWHEKFFDKIFKSIGYKTKAMNEGMSVVFAECAAENFTGVGISFGAGLTNIACAINGIPTLTFSVSRGGDWIDDSVAANLGINSNKVTKVKEKSDFNLLDPKSGERKAERRIREALAIYYENLINYVLKVFINEFKNIANGIDLDTDIPIVISGGTSKANGFVDLFKEIFERNKDDFPFDVSEIRVASDQLDAVARGNLVYALWEEKKNNVANSATDSEDGTNGTRERKSKNK